MGEGKQIHRANNEKKVACRCRCRAVLLGD